MDAKEMFRVMGSRRFVRKSAIAYLDALPAATLTYSQGGEDMALFKRLKARVQAKETSFFVDIGCGHPHEVSNSFLFYTFGWRGLCVDANADHAPAWALHRPEDLFVHAAVAEQEGTTSLYRSTGENWGIARIGDSPIKGMKAGVPVATRRLDRLLAEHAGERSIAFMSIDVEGSEYGVLASNNWERWRPEVILMEVHGFDFNAPFASPAARLLVEHRYMLTDKIGENLLFQTRD